MSLARCRAARCRPTARTSLRKCCASGAASGLPPAMAKSLTLLTATAGFARQNARQRSAEGDGAKCGAACGCGQLRLCSVRLSQPSSVALHAGRAGFHVILRIEVRARRVGRSGGVHDREMPLVPQRLERRHAGCSPKKPSRSITVARNVDARPHRVVRRLAVRDDDVEAVGRAALEDYDQPLVAIPGSAAPKAARVRKPGTAAVPTTAIAPLRRKCDV